MIQILHVDTDGNPVSHKKIFNTHHIREIGVNTPNSPRGHEVYMFMDKMPEDYRAKTSVPKEEKFTPFKDPIIQEEKGFFTYDYSEEVIYNSKDPNDCFRFIEIIAEHLGTKQVISVKAIAEQILEEKFKCSEYSTTTQQNG